MSLITIAAFAYNLGSDTSEYYRIFKTIPTIGELSIDIFSKSKHTWQPGFVLLFSFLKTLCNNYLFYQIFHAILINIIIFRFVKKYSICVGLTLFFYCMLNYLDYNFEIQRESFCIILGLLIFDLFHTNNTYKYFLSFLLIFFAIFLLHKSAVILFFIPFLFKIRVTKPRLLYFLILTFVTQIIWTKMNVGIIMDYISGDIYKHYVSQELQVDINNPVNYLLRYGIVKILIPYFFIYFSFIQRPNSKHIIFAVLSVMFNCLVDFTFAFHRFWGYFTPFYWLCMADTVYFFIRRYNIFVKIMSLACLVVLIIYTYHMVYFSFDWSRHEFVYERYFPYRSIFEYGNKY